MADITVSTTIDNFMQAADADAAKAILNIGAGGSGGTVQNANRSIEPTDAGGITGNARGSNAVDLQSSRTQATHVASNTYATIENDVIQGRLSFGVDMKNMVASFEHTGAQIMSNNQIQISGETLNDFSSIQNYQVTTDDGKSGQYEVDMT